MDTGNGTKAVYADAAGKPVAKPTVGSDLASPIDLLNPDRYEFYTFDNNGDLIRRLMTWNEIRGIIASGDGDGFSSEAFTSQGYMPEKRVDDVVNNVQNVLKEEIESHKDHSGLFDTPDVSDTWSMILPAIFGNSGQTVESEKPLIHDFPDTIMVEPTSQPNTITYVKDENLLIDSENNLNTEVTTSKLFIKIATTNSDERHRTKPPIAMQKVPGSTVTATSLPTSTNKFISTPQYIKLPNTNYTVLSTTTPSALLSIWKTNFAETQDTKLATTTSPASLDSPIRSSTFRSILSTLIPMSLSTASNTSFPFTQWSTIRMTTVSPGTSLKANETDSKVSPFLDESLSTLPPYYSAARDSETTPFEETTVPIYTTGISFGTSIAQSETTNFSTMIDSNTELSTNGYGAMSTTLSQSNYSEITTELLTQDSEDQWKTSHEISTYIPSVNSFLLNISNKDEPDLKFTTSDETVKISTTTDAYQENTDTNEENSLYTTTTIPKSNIMNALEETTTSREITTDKSKFAITEFMPEETTDLLTRISATEILEQLLLSPDNMYLINSDVPETPSNAVTSKDAETSMTTELESRTTQEITESITNSGVTGMSTTHMENTYASSVTTDRSMVNRSENQLVSDSSTKTNTSTATLNFTTYSDATTTEINSLNENGIISNSVGAILSQVFGYDHLELNNVTFMTSPTTEENVSIGNEFFLSSNRDLEDQTSTHMSPVTDITTSNYEPTLFKATTVSYYDSMTSTTITESETMGTASTFQWETSTAASQETEQSSDIQYTSTSMTTDASTERDEPHLINITFISNERYKNLSKPAKSDTSLEVDYDYGIIENISANNSYNKLLETGAFTSKEDQISDATENNELISTSHVDIPQTNQFNRDPINTNIRFNNVHTTNFPSHNIPEESTEKLNKVSDKDKTQSTMTMNQVNNSVIAVNINENEFTKHASEHTGNTSDSPWALVSTIAPHSQTEHINESEHKPALPYIGQSQKIDLVPEPLQGFGLEESIAKLDKDIYQFVQLCNELAFGFWNSVTNRLSHARSLVISPFATTSLLAMVFLGARGATSGEMNELLKLDDMVTFNPHLIFKNVSESIETRHDSGLAVSAIVRQLYSDRSRGKILDFYKERVRQFYDGHVEEVNFKEIGDIIRRRTNLLIKKQTDRRNFTEFLKDNSITVRSPLAAVSASVFQTDCSQASSTGRDGELYFVVLPTIRQRRLIPVPAVVYRSNFLAGYEPSLDATAVALGSKNQSISTIFILPGQQGIMALGDGLSRLEKRLVESSFKTGAWSRLLRSLIPRPGLEIHLPRFSHRSIINATFAIKQLGVKDLFNPFKADLRGLSGNAHELYLSDMLQINDFSTCGEDRTLESHHSEIYPAPSPASRGKYLGIYGSENVPTHRRIVSNKTINHRRSFHDHIHDPRYLLLPLNSRPRQTQLPEPPRLRFDRPFLFVVRHNPTGLILHMGRFNPRLLP